MWGGLSPLRSSGLNRLVDFSGGYTRPTLCLLLVSDDRGVVDDTMETMKQMPTEPMKPVAADGRKAIEQALKRVPCAVLEQSLEKRHETRTY